MSVVFTARDDDSLILEPQNLLDSPNSIDWSLLVCCSKSLSLHCTYNVRAIKYVLYN